MKKIKYWTESETGKDGYTIIEVTFHAEWMIDDGDRCEEKYGKERKTLVSAINDAKKFFKKENGGFTGIYANAEILQFYDDGTKFGKTEEDCARLGTIDPNGEYFDLCEQVEWL